MCQNGTRKTKVMCQNGTRRTKIMCQNGALYRRGVHRNPRGGRFRRAAAKQKAFRRRSNDKRHFSRSPHFDVRGAAGKPLSAVKTKSILRARQNKIPLIGGRAGYFGRAGISAGGHYGGSPAAKQKVFPVRRKTKAFPRPPRECLETNVVICFLSFRGNTRGRAYRPSVRGGTP